MEVLQDQLKSARAEASPPPGVVDWSVEFAEVFDKRGGFDVVVANPPYVRQESIGPDKATLKLQYAGAVTARSDLYCYFYARALQMLRVGGMHVFVCSNSWLDVGYGAKLQEYLLKNAHVRAIYESAIERQFSTARINTIISIIAKTPGDGTQRTRFVSLREEFERAIAHAESRREMTVTSAELMEAGLGAPKGSGPRKFVGDKWGGKYLRAPDIYWTILEKGRGTLVRLGDIVQVDYGIKTGANKFFCVDKKRIEEWEIEDEFLQPIMTTPKESRSITVDIWQLPKMLFVCHEGKENLGGTAALEYILWGESKGFSKRTSVSSRPIWYDLGHRVRSRLAMNLLVHNTARTYLVSSACLFTHNFLTIGSATMQQWKICALLNSTLIQLMLNISGRVNFGEGVLEIQTYELANLPVVEPRLLQDFEWSNFQSEDWEVLSPSPGRRLIDDAVLDIFGLTQGERDAVYEGVTELVENRRSRAKSV